MSKNAAFRESVKPRSAPLAIAVLLSSVLLLVGLGGTASAAPPGKNGTIHACYKVKGKPKGAMRVVMSAKARCRRGERKVAWSAVGPGGQAGSPGQVGTGGQSGTSGSDGSGAGEVALKTEIAALNLKVEALEGVLEGVTNGDLKGALGTLQGLDNEELLGAVAATPLVETVCGQAEALTGQSNALLTLLDTLDTLDVLSLPAALPTFEACPEP